MEFKIKSLVKTKEQLPELLQKEYDNQYERIKGRLTEQQLSLLDKRAEFPFVLAMSDFIANTIFSYPKECCDLIEKGALDSQSVVSDLKSFTDEYLNEKQNDFELKKRLRVVRRTRAMVIAWRELCGYSKLEEVFSDLSYMASTIVLKTLAIVRSQLVPVFGDALCSDGSPMPLLTLGMGKLGGGELNFSSDIDLIFAYPYEGETKGKARSLTHREFFTRIVQRSANLLSDKTVDTFAYRIDLRLRPFGDAGAMVNSFDALQVYYET